MLKLMEHQLVELSLVYSEIPYQKLLKISELSVQVRKELVNQESLSTIKVQYSIVLFQVSWHKVVISPMAQALVVNQFMVKSSLMRISKIPIQNLTFFQWQMQDLAPMVPNSSLHSYKLLG